MNINEMRQSSLNNLIGNDWELKCASSKVVYKSSPLSIQYRLSTDNPKSWNYINRRTSYYHRQYAHLCTYTCSYIRTNNIRTSLQKAQGSLLNDYKRIDTVHIYSYGKVRKWSRFVATMQYTYIINITKSTAASLQLQNIASYRSR